MSYSYIFDRDLMLYLTEHYMAKKQRLYNYIYDRDLMLYLT